MTQKNQMYTEMQKAAKDRLKGKNPLDIAKKAGICFDGQVFRFHSLGQEIRVQYPDYEISPLLDDWYQLVILHYLAMADGSELSRRWIRFGEQKNGLIRGGGFDRRAECLIQQLGKRSPEKLKNSCLSLGGVEKEAKADLSVEFSFLPNYLFLIRRNKSA